MAISSRDQLYAFSLLIIAILALGLAPIIGTLLTGKTLPDALIAVSDKTVTGLVGVLGTVAAMVFRTNRSDEIKAENTGKALDNNGKTLDTINNAIASPAPAADPNEPQKVIVTNDEDNSVPIHDSGENQ